MRHPFDTLTYDDIWETELYWDVFDSVAKLSLYGEEDSPESWQRDVFDDFFKNQGNLKPKIYDAIFEYYQSVAPEYRDRVGKNYSKYVPYIKSIDELKTLLEPDSVFISDLAPDRKEVGVLFECSWEPEHGLGVKIINGEIVEVGYQDICL